MRQFFLFLIFGVAQLVVDVLIFRGLLIFGIDPWISNVISRFLALLVGFFLNGKMTFHSFKAEYSQWKSFIRLMILWVVLTSMSSFAIELFDRHFSSIDLVWVKLLVEAVLAIISFLVSKYWVYK